MLEGVMMRGVATWAVAVRKPAEDGARRSSVQTFPLESWNRRRRMYRWPVIRGVVALVESLGIGLRALGISANAQLPGRSRRSRAERGSGTVAVAIVFAIGLFFVVPVGLTSLVKHQLGSLGCVLGGRGRAPDRDLPRLSAAALAGSRSAPGVRVPRRRAQGDLVLRGVRRADARAREAVLAVASPVRHELPADRDDHGDLRVRADRAARVVDPGDHPDRRRAADRRAVVRGDQVGRS